MDGMCKSKMVAVHFKKNNGRMFWKIVELHTQTHDKHCIGPL